MSAVPIVQVTMADTPSPTKQSLVDKVAALDIKGGIPQSASPGAVTPTLSNPLSPVSPTAPGSSPFGSLGAVKDEKTNIGGAGHRKASIHEGPRMSFTTTGGERKGSTVGSAGSRRPSRRGSGVITTPSGQQAVFHTRTNVRYRDRVRADFRMIWSFLTLKRVCRILSADIGLMAETIQDQLRKYESLLTCKFTSRIR
jgi:hypothetical protein